MYDVSLIGKSVLRFCTYLLAAYLIYIVKVNKLEDQYYNKQRLKIIT
jgi:hypothetical protein